jgi:hypothetical protein
MTQHLPRFSPTRTRGARAASLVRGVRAATLARGARAAALAAAVLLAASAAVRAAGQAPPRPAPAWQCPAGTPMCVYAERQLALDGYRYQMMWLSGGADWDTQLWVSDAQNRLLLAVPPSRGSAVLAVQRLDAGARTATSAVRVVTDYYTPTDPAVAPSGYASTIYDYDPASQQLVAQPPAILPRTSPAELQQTLSGEGWTVVLSAD